MKNSKKPAVSIVMGSDSDLPVMSQAAMVLEELGVEFDIQIVSAHRTPELLFSFGKNTHLSSVKVIIAGAGGAAHLPGMIASLTPLPVIGVPLRSRVSIDGWDSVLSILQMPPGIPVATVALDGARNAGILAAQILGAHEPQLLKKVQAFKESLKNSVTEKIEKLNKIGYKKYLAVNKKKS